MITKSQLGKMGEQLDELVHDLKGKEASYINNQGPEAQVQFLVDAGMTHAQIVEACGLKVLKCNRWITDGVPADLTAKKPTLHYDAIGASELQGVSEDEWESLRNSDITWGTNSATLVSLGALRNLDIWRTKTLDAISKMYGETIYIDLEH